MQLRTPTFGTLVGFGLQICAGAAAVIWPSQLWVAYWFFALGLLTIAVSAAWWVATNRATARLPIDKLRNGLRSARRLRIVRVDDSGRVIGQQALTQGDTLTATATVRDPTPEELAFRAELRRFIVRLEVAEARLSDLLEHLFRWDRQENGNLNEHLQFYVREAVERRRPNMTALSQAVQVDVQAMSHSSVQGALKEFLLRDYVYFQSALRDFNHVANIDFSKAQALQAWLKEDHDCLRRLQDIKASPLATLLLMLPDDVMGSSRDRGWGLPTRAPRWPNFTAWDQRDTFELYQAACLWFLTEPLLPMPERPKSLYQNWKSAIENGGTKAISRWSRRTPLWCVKCWKVGRRSRAKSPYFSIQKSEANK